MTALSTLMSLLRFTEYKENKRSAILALATQLSLAYLLAYLVILRYFKSYACFLNHHTWFHVLLISVYIVSLFLIDKSVKKYVSDNLINTLLKTFNKKLNTDEDFRKAFLDLSQNFSNEIKINEIISNYFKEEVNVKHMRLFAILSFFFYFVYFLLLSTVLITINGIYNNVFTSNTSHTSILVLIIAYFLFIGRKLIADRKGLQIEHERLAISVVSSFVSTIKNVIYFKKIIYCIYVCIAAPLNPYTAFNSLFESESNQSSQNSPSIYLIYLLEEQNENGQINDGNNAQKLMSNNKKEKENEAKRMECEENVQSFLHYLSDKIGAKSVQTMTKDELNKIFCEKFKNYEITTNGFASWLCNNSLADDKIIEVRLLFKRIPFDDSYKIESLFRSMEELFNTSRSVMLFERVGGNINSTYLTLLRFRLRIEDLILTPHSANHKKEIYRKKNVPCNREITLIVVVS